MISSRQDCAFRDGSKMGIKEGQLIASRIDAVNWPFGDPVPGSRCSVWLRIVHCFKKSGFYGEHPVGLSPGDDPLRSRLTPTAPINARFHPCILFSVLRDNDDPTVTAGTPDDQTAVTLCAGKNKRRLAQRASQPFAIADPSFPFTLPAPQARER